MTVTRMDTDLLRCKEAVAFLIWLLQVRNLPILFFISMCHVIKISNKQNNKSKYKINMCTHNSWMVEPIKQNNLSTLKGMVFNFSLPGHICNLLTNVRLSQRICVCRSNFYLMQLNNVDKNFLIEFCKFCLELLIKQIIAWKIN